MTKLQRITAIARRVRTWAERLQARLCTWNDSLEGMCGICAYEIFKRARRVGIHCRVVISDDHAFVIYCGQIIDVTATQFSDCREKYPKVVVRPFTDKGSASPWDSTRSYSTIKAIRKVMKRWPRCQSPFLLRDERVHANA